MNTTLHISQLPEFKRWLMGKGWAEREPRDEYEALRLTRRGKYGNSTLLVRRESAEVEDLPVGGLAGVAARAWLKERKNG